MSNLQNNLPNKNTDTLLAVISTKLDNLIDKFEKLEDQLDNKVNISTFQAHLDAHKKYLENLDERLVEERKHREDIKEDMAYSKGIARITGGIWGAVSSVAIGVATYILTK